MIDGTPILDVKPYIPIYDNPSQAKYELVIVLSIFTQFYRIYFMLKKTYFLHFLIQIIEFPLKDKNLTGS